MKKVTTLFALTLLVGCGDRGCGAPAPDTAPPSTDKNDAATSPGNTSAVESGAPEPVPTTGDASTTPGKQFTYRGKTQDAGFAPNGHVLFATANGHVLDWNLTAEPRDVDLGAAGGKVTNVHIASGASGFVVERESGKDATRIELWDADKVTKVRDLEGTFEATQRFAISRDRSRLLFGRCMYKPDRDKVLQCDGAVYQLPSGDLVHRSTFTPMEVQGYVPTLALSPSGRLLSAESQLAPSELRDAVTGNLVLTVIDHSWGSVDESGLKLLWLDDTHVLHTARQGTALSVENIPPPPERKQPPITLRVTQKKEETMSTPRLSADRRRVAAVAHLESGADLVIWDTIANESHRHPVPRDICIDNCDVSWDGDHVSVFSHTTTPTVSMRVNALTKEEKMEPFRPTPTYAGSGFTVLSTLTASSAESIAYARKRENVPPSSLVVVTPNGTRADLGVSPDAASIAVSADHILIGTLKSTHVLSKTGEWSRLDLQ